MSATETSPAPSVVPAHIEKLYRQHHPMILRTVFRLTRDMADAEDVLQSLFVRLMLQAEGAGPGEDAGPYLHRAAVNAALDILRRRPLSRPMEAVPPMRSALGPRPDEVSDQAELGDRLRGAIARLAPRMAEIFTLRFVEGCTNGEIARMLGTSWSVVAVTLHRARRALRKDLQFRQGETS